MVGICQNEKDGLNTKSLIIFAPDCSHPIQLLCADLFHYKGINYLVIVDRYSNWLIIERARDGAKGLIDCLRRTFGTFGIPEELSTDGGPEFTSSLSQEFLKICRPIKDFISILPSRYTPHHTWKDTLAAREEALRNQHMRSAERWSEHTKRLPPLTTGDYVRIPNWTPSNQMGQDWQGR